MPTEPSQVDPAREADFDIAIVGMSCRFPGAQNVDEFWFNLANGIESISRLSDSELIKEGVSERILHQPNYVKAAPVLSSPGMFDAAFFGLAPAEAKAIDPQHRILLELAYEALEDASCDPERSTGRISVFTGAAMNTYFLNNALQTRFRDEYIPILIGNDKDFLSTRISYKLNLKGPSITIQTACSTSLVAIHLARQSLLTQESDVALAGAISVRVPHQVGYWFEPGGVLSADGHVRAFDAKANGTVFGSGGGMIVLKRLADALAAGDNIHAVIKGSAVNNDGSEKAGYTAPSVNSQADVVVEAMGNAGVNAESISYIEAHGSGTLVGDPIEIMALTKAFRASTSRRAFCALGSVKTNLGHLDAAAGVAGLIKTVLALKHRQLPPSLHFSEPNPQIDFPQTPFFVNTSLTAWTSEQPRRAGVMSTGIGGTNAHLILEEAPERPVTSRIPCEKILVLSARTPSALDACTTRLIDYFQREERANLDDVCYTLQIGRQAFCHRKVLVCSEEKDALMALTGPQSKRIASNQCAGGVGRPLILLLPGIGDHYVGMAHGLYTRWAAFRKEVDLCALLLHPHLGIDIRDVLYPKTEEWKKLDKSKAIDLREMLRKADQPISAAAQSLNRTLYAQPALFVIEYALARLWQSWGINPHVIIGHSMGEYVAACLSGVFSLPDALSLIAGRARLVEALPTSAMLAVPLPEGELRPLLNHEISIALINSPSVCVVAGPAEAVARFSVALEKRGVVCRPVQNAHAFHSKMLDPIVEAFEQLVRKVPLRPATIPFISNVSGTWITAAEAADPGYWARHATKTARFSDALAVGGQMQDPIWLEAGPGRTLGLFVMQQMAGSRRGDIVSIASLRHHYENQSDEEFLLRAVGQLWLAGGVIDWEKLHQGEGRQRCSLPTYPFEHQHLWLESVARPADSSAPAFSIHKQSDIARWFYVPSWKRLIPKRLKADSAQDPLSRNQSWLIFCDAGEFSVKVVQRLKGLGARVATVRAGSTFSEETGGFTLDPANGSHYERLIHTLQSRGQAPTHIVHGWSLIENGGGSKQERFQSAQWRGFYSLVFIAQALAKHNLREEINLAVVSAGIQDVHGREALAPEKSTLFGPCLVIPQEYPNIFTKSIDLDGIVGQATNGADVERFLAEIIDWDSELFVAFRNGERWVQSYEAVSLPEPVTTPPVFRHGGVYLITGGLGNIGFEMAKFLAATYSAKLLLVGRSVLKESGVPVDGGNVPSFDITAERLNRVKQIELLGGEVLYRAADVSDSEAMRQVVSDGLGCFGVLHGVIHAAGIVGETGICEIAAITPADCEPHFRSKAGGLQVLEDVLGDRPLDFCMAVSSLTPILGGIGETAYAASNLFMDAFVRQHNRRSPKSSWISINWDLWRLEQSNQSGAVLGKTLQELGITADEGLQILPRVLSLKDVAQLVVSTGDLSARIRQWIKLDSIRLQNAEKSAGPSRQTSPAAKPGSQPLADETERTIARVWEEALGLENIGREEHFGELGGHSLLAIKIISELRRVFQIDLAIRSLFEAPTVAKLAEQIRALILAEIEQMSDAEAAELARKTNTSA